MAEFILIKYGASQPQMKPVQSKHWEMGEQIEDLNLATFPLSEPFVYSL